MRNTIAAAFVGMAVITAILALPLAMPYMLCASVALLGIGLVIAD